MINTKRNARSYYYDTISEFLDRGSDEIIGLLTRESKFAIEIDQSTAWLEQIRILKDALIPYRNRGSVHFEYSIPRLGKRIDTLAIIDHVIFVIEFKVGSSTFGSNDIDQVLDYALDLKNFHEESHDKYVAPILIATSAKSVELLDCDVQWKSQLHIPIKTTPVLLDQVLSCVLRNSTATSIKIDKWNSSRYSPSPTIIEAALFLYAGHDVADISRNDTSAINLTKTSLYINSVIADSQRKGLKSICFVTGVPGAGKTLVGLDIATQHFDKENDLHSVYLSGNGPLVAILREALARDSIKRKQSKGLKITKGEATREVSLFIQNVHHFRDECLVHESIPPLEHVVLFDEAQRAWNLEATAQFMKRKKGRSNFDSSEPKFLISCLDRHKDWAVIVCLVGGGQEINRGEAGISEWIEALRKSFPAWKIHISQNLQDSEYGAGEILSRLMDHGGVQLNSDLHLAVSMRSFRAESVSQLVKCLLDLEVVDARQHYDVISGKFPIVITRKLQAAKSWLRIQARGSERYGIVVSSEAQRLKPHAIDVRTPVNPVHWFLDGKDDVRSSYFLEDVATEFQVQGLELDWVCVVWDGDFRYHPNGWNHFSFVGSKWNKIHKIENQNFLKNAYRVLLTRARQGMVIVVPESDSQDHTRRPDYYDPTYEYLRSIGFLEI